MKIYRFIFYSSRDFTSNARVLNTRFFFSFFPKCRYLEVKKKLNKRLWSQLFEQLSVRKKIGEGGIRTLEPFS